jgi:hypothetical protein
MKVGSHPIIFMVDSGTEHSVVTKPVVPHTKCRATIVGATSTQSAQQFWRPWTCQVGGQEVTHKSLYLPEGFSNKAWSPNHLQPGRAYKPYSERTKCPHHASDHAYERQMWLFCQEKVDLAKPICLLEFTDVWAEKGPSGLACAHNARSQTWGSSCQTVEISNTMGSTCRNSDPPTLAEGCRDFNWLTITMEHPIVAH